MSPDAILDSLEAYVYSKDLDGNYTWANRAVCELFGRPLIEIVGHDDSQYFDLVRSQALRDIDAAVMTSGRTIRQEEHDVVAATGEERVYWVSKSPLRDEAGSIIGMCGLSIDITAR